MTNLKEALMYYKRNIAVLPIKIIIYIGINKQNVNDTKSLRSKIIEKLVYQAMLADTVI